MRNENIDHIISHDIQYNYIFQHDQDMCANVYTEQNQKVDYIKVSVNFWNVISDFFIVCEVSSKED